MGTKNNPGKFDCYANAEPDEPMFVLLGRDKHAPLLVKLWADLRAMEGEDIAKVTEAILCANAMGEFRRKRKIAMSGSTDAEFDPNNIAEVRERVRQFQALELSGQPLRMHMGTAYLVHDLDRLVARIPSMQEEIERLRGLATVKGALGILEIQTKDIQRLRALNAELREALQRYANWWDDAQTSEQLVNIQAIARAVLAKTEAPQEAPQAEAGQS